jgi:hypothetical protein
MLFILFFFYVFISLSALYTGSRPAASTLGLRHSYFPIAVSQQTGTMPLLSVSRKVCCKDTNFLEICIALSKKNIK